MTTKRIALFALLLASAAALLAACAAPSTTTSTTPIAPTATPAARPVVLVHGAWMDASAWDRVAANLRARGLSVTAVNLPGHGTDTTPPETLSLAGYADAVLAALPKDQAVTLVGHSMAGMVISLVAERAPERVGNLVYVAAYLPRSGDSLYTLSQQDTDSRVGRYWTQADPKTYSPASIKPEGIVDVFCADCSADDQRRLVQTHKAEAVPPLGTPVTLTAERSGRVPRVYVHTLRDNAVSHSLQKRMLEQAGGAQTVVTLDSGHSPMLSRPRELAAVIAQAAQK